VLEGFTPFPEEFIQKYREKGYWQDSTLADTFTEVCRKYANRVAVCDAKTEVTYADLDDRATNLALNFLEIGLRSGDHVVLQLGNVLEFVYTYFAFLKIGVRPILALHTHRYRELKQFVEISKAVAICTADKSKDCDFADIVNRIELVCPSLKTKIMLGEVAEGFHSLSGLITNTTTRNPSEIEQIQKTIDPCEPALFLLSGGTTGIPKLIPRTHNDYICNSKLAAKHTEITPSSVLLAVLPIAHNLPLACPGMQGFMLTGAKIVLHKSTRAAEVFSLIEKYKVTHIHIVPALLIIWMHDPLVKDHNLTSVQVIQSGGQRLQPETRILTERLLVNCTVQENFGMAEGMLMYVRLDDPLDVRRETVGRAMCDDDEIMLLGENDLPVKPGEVGEFCARGPYTLRGYFNAPEHNIRAFTKDGFYRSGDLMRQHKSGNYIVEGRKKDLINRGGEKISAEEVENLILSSSKIKNVACVAMPDPVLGEKMCAFVILKEGKNLTLDELNKMLLQHEIAKFKLPERLEIVDQFPLSTFGKVSKKDLVAIVTKKLQQGDKTGV
tara:strand:+ start:3266 stop:4927 length:1662 start_codon:yes stop_codon:yes gene_type:complete